MNGIRDALRLLALMAGAVGLLPQLALTAAILLAGAAVATYKARPAAPPAVHSFSCPSGR